MELSWLKQFQTAATLNHITRAAEQLYISQPALSKTIHLLEEEFKVPLFDRSGKRVQLNENGKILLKYTNRIFQDLENAHAEIDKLNHQEKNTIVLSTLAASYLLPDILIKFREKYPDIIFSLRQSSNVSQEEDYDLQIFSSGEFLYDSNIKCILKEEIFLAIPKDHPLSSRGQISLFELEDTPFIGLQKGLGLASIIDHYCSAIGFTPNVIMETDNPSTLRKFIQLGFGVAFLPSVTWNLKTDDIRQIRISDFASYRYLFLKWKKDSHLSQASEQFRDFMIEYFKQYQRNHS